MKANRRQALVCGALGLVVAVAPGGVLARRGKKAAGAEPLTPYVSIAVDGAVTIGYPATEIGQGSMSALTMIVAEELDADWSRVAAAQINAAATVYGNPGLGGSQTTVASRTVQGYFEPLRKAGAAARAMLIEGAGRHWGVAPSRLVAADHAVSDPVTGRRMGYGEAAAYAASLRLPVPEAPVLKKPEQFRLIGSRRPRLDIPDKVRGATRYAIDVIVPRMAHAAVLLPPVEGERLLSLDEAPAHAMPGVIAVVRAEDIVAVVAEHFDQALAARNALSPVWSEASPFRDGDSVAEAQALAQLAAGDAAGVVHAGEQAAPLRSGPGIVTRSYSTGYVYHAQIEPLAAVAAIDADSKGAEIWVGTQSQSAALHYSAQAMGVPPEKIRLNVMMSGGGFGRRLNFERELVRDALRCARAARRPVKLIWTREEDVAGGWFRPPTAHTLRARLDGARIAAWHHRVAAPEVLPFYDPAGWERARPRDFLVMSGATRLPYAPAQYRVEHCRVDRIARLTALRSIGTGANAFAIECFVDELAAVAGLDPLAFRLANLKDNPRATAVLGALADMVPRDVPAGRVRGLALAGYGDSLCAGMVEITPPAAGAAPRVHRIWAAADAGLVVSPANAEAQIEGGILFGLSVALAERITIKGGRVEQANFADYSILRADAAPELAVRILPSGLAPSSVGELGVPFVAPALANALAAADGRRTRQLPLVTG